MDIARMRILAGLQPLNESYGDDDDDGLSPAERELAASAEKELKKKGVKVKNVDPDKEMSKLAKSTKKVEDDDQDDEKPAPKAAPEKKEVKATPEKKEEKAEKKEEKAEKKEEKAEEKAEEKKEEAKRKGRKTSERGGAVSEWLKSNPTATRGAFIQYASSHGMSKAHANTMFYVLKKRMQVSEFYVLKNTATGRVLAEYSSYDTPTWTLFENEFGLDSKVFETEDAALSAQFALRSNGHRVQVELVSADDVSE